MDHLLADEQWEYNGSGHETLWALGDHLGTVRDLIDSSGTIRKHTAYDSFGNRMDEQYWDSSGNAVTAADPAAVDTLFGVTGRPLDETTGLQNNLNRWYDSKSGKWISEDPIGFAAGDANLSRYVGNHPSQLTDPSGQVPPVAIGIGIVVGWYFLTPDNAHAPRDAFEAAMADELDAARADANAQTTVTLLALPCGGVAAGAAVDMAALRGMNAAVHRVLLGGLAGGTTHQLATDIGFEVVAPGTGISSYPQDPWETAGRYGLNVTAWTVLGAGGEAYGRFRRAFSRPTIRRGVPTNIGPFSAKAPRNVAPRVRQLEGHYVDDLGCVQP